MTIKVTSSGWTDPQYLNDTDAVIIKSPGNLIGHFSNFCNEVHLWCFENYIEADMVSKWYEDGYDYSRWVIKNERDRTMFSLRWA